MDSGVSWPEAIMLSKARFPKANLEATLHFAKQIYLFNHSFDIKKQKKDTPDNIAYTKENKNYLLQGAAF